jgi:hypothetical protein
MGLLFMLFKVMDGRLSKFIFMISSKIVCSISQIGNDDVRRLICATNVKT